MKKGIIAILVILALLSHAAIIYAEMRSDTEFVYVATTLKNTKLVSFSAVTYEPKTSITVTRVWLYKKDSNDVWRYDRELPLPANPSTTPKTYSASEDYSGYIGSGTYRIYTTFYADGHSLSGYSNARTF